MTKISVSIPEAVALTGIGRSSLYKIIGEGRLVPRKQGKRTLIMVKDLEELIQNLPTTLSDGR